MFTLIPSRDSDCAFNSIFSFSELLSRVSHITCSPQHVAFIAFHPSVVPSVNGCLFQCRIQYHSFVAIQRVYWPSCDLVGSGCMPGLGPRNGPGMYDGGPRYSDSCHCHTNKRVPLSFRHPTFAALLSATGLPQCCHSPPLQPTKTHTTLTREGLYSERIPRFETRTYRYRLRGVTMVRAHVKQTVCPSAPSAGVFSHRSMYVLWLIHLALYSQRRRRNRQRRRHRPRRSQRNQVHGHVRSMGATRSSRGKRT